MAAGQKTGGRQKGTPNKATSEKIAEIAASGLMPLDFMLSLLRNEQAPNEERMWAAEKAAPYVHAKLSSVEVAGKDGGPIQLMPVINVHTS